MINLKKPLLIVTLLLFTFVYISNSTVQQSVQAIETLKDYYEIDNVYSTYSSSTNYTIGGAVYTSDAGVLVRSISTEKVTAGLSLPIEETLTVTESSALVLNAMFYSNLSRSMKIELVDSEDNTISMHNADTAYLAKNNKVVNPVTIINNSFSNCLNASSGYGTNDYESGYNQLVIPFTSFGYNVGETIEMSSINFYAPAWSTSTYNKYLLSTINISQDFDATQTFSLQNIWDSSLDSYLEYGDCTNNLDIDVLSAGEIFMDPSINGSGNAVLQQLVFKFPDELINEAGYVETANLAGLTFEYANETNTSFNACIKLFNTDGSNVANSNYMNLKTHKVTKTGVEADSNAKYFYSNTNTVGYANSYILYNFDATDTVTEASEESFYSSLGDLPNEISPYFAFSYDASTTFSLAGVYFKNMRILTSDTTVYQNTYSSSEDVILSNVSGYLGDTITFKATTSDRLYSTVKINDVELTQADKEDLFSSQGLTKIITGDMHLQIIFEDELPIDITKADSLNGEVTLSSSSIVLGQNLSVKCIPDTGYKLSWLKVNGIDVTESVLDNIYITKVLERLHITAGFMPATQYQLEDGAISSLYNSQPGTIWAEFDSINIQTTYDFRDSLEEAYIGISIADLNQQVDNDAYIVIDVHSMVNMWRTFYISINGNDNYSDAPYYLMNRYHEITQKTGTGIISESEPCSNLTNATLSLTNTEGFYGQIIIPLSSYTQIEEINDITIKTLVKDKSYARFNIGNIYIVDEFSPTAGANITSSDMIWSPETNNFSSIDSTNQYSQCQYLNKGEVILESVVSNPFGYDALYVSLPQNMINSDGYVDLEDLGIKGIAIDVKNYNVLQHSLAIRIAGSDNSSLTDTEHSLWQTSISNHPASIIYPTGLVKNRNSAYIPFDDSGQFNGTIYIPLDSIGFTSIGASGSFPSLIQPLMRILPGSMNDTSYTTYDFEMSNIRFITDTSEFDTYQITMTQIGGTINATIGSIPVSNSSNNNVLDETHLNVTVIPDNGYSVTQVFYQMAEDEIVYVDLDHLSDFEITIEGNILIQVICDEIDYAITYELDDGINHSDNPSTYTVESSTILLEAPEKDGYRFKGWYVDDELVTEITSGNTGDLTLTALWEEDTFLANISRWFIDVNLWIKIAVPTFVGGLVVTTILITKKRK